MTLLLWNFDSICDRNKTRREISLACSMITISENATLKKNSISTEMVLCDDCDQQKCQDIFFIKLFFIVIWSINTISVNVKVLQMEVFYASHDRVDFSCTLYHNRNLILRVNNKSLYPKFYKMYKSNKCREMIFISNQHLCSYPNELKFELLHVS